MQFVIKNPNPHAICSKNSPAFHSVQWNQIMSESPPPPHTHTTTYTHKHTQTHKQNKKTVLNIISVSGFWITRITYIFLLLDTDPKKILFWGAHLSSGFAKRLLATSEILRLKLSPRTNSHYARSFPALTLEQNKAGRQSGFSHF